MANTVTFAQNGYAGEVLEDLLTYTAQGNDTYREGLIHIKTGVQKKYTLPMIKLGNVIQDNVPTPTTQGGVNGELNKYTLTERYLEPQDFMVYLEFNPRDFESYYKFAQPTGNLEFRELNPKVQATMLRLLMDRTNEYLGNAIWTSAKGGNATCGVTEPAGCVKIGDGAEKYFDGFIKRVIDNANAVDEATVAGGQVVIAGTTTLTTGEAVESAMYTMWQKCNTAVRKESGLVFVMDWDSWDLYDQYLSAKSFKYTDNTESNKHRFKGKRIVPINGIPPHTIVLGQFTSDMKSNLWMAVDYSDDENVLKVAPLQANSELYFFQMRMKMDVNIVRPAEIVVHTAYTKKVA